MLALDPCAPVRGDQQKRRRFITSMVGFERVKAETPPATESSPCAWAAAGTARRNGRRAEGER